MIQTHYCKYIMVLQNNVTINPMTLVIMKTY